MKDKRKIVCPVCMRSVLIPAAEDKANVTMYRICEKCKERKG